MAIAQQVLFFLITVIAVYFFVKKVREIRRNILLGTKLDITDNSSQRWKNVILLAFGQKKMFTNPLVAVLHFFVYVGFIIINIEILEIILDGLLGTHRIFSEVLGGFYQILISSFELLAVLVLVSVIIFLIRRNITKVHRLTMKELKGWPKNDANIILFFEVVLMSLFLIMNMADYNLQQLGSPHYHEVGGFMISKPLSGWMNGWSDVTLISIERVCWWLHIAGIFIFMNYLPFSKHLHIVLAFPNAYYASLDPKGKMQNMPEIQKEVLYMMQPELATNADPNAVVKFGAKDVFDLSWKNLMDAYSCTECGRCTAACPANQTGKKLSPRKIMMDTRDRLEAVGMNLNVNSSFVDDGRTLLHDYITVEELRACTTCNACVQECPVSISPLDIIIQLRRNLVMEESNSPQEWNMMFSNIENNMAPWKFSPDDRDAWVAS